MPHTDEQLQRAAEKAMDFDPSRATNVIDGTPIREITAATEAIRQAEARQREAVQIARARGISWNLIALALGVSRQAARQRFADHAPGMTIRSSATPKRPVRSAVSGAKKTPKRTAAKRKTAR